jgi:hypothetical protein
VWAIHSGGLAYADPDTPTADINTWFECASAMLKADDADSRVARGIALISTHRLIRAHSQTISTLQKDSQLALTAATELVFKAFDMEETLPAMLHERPVLFSRPVAPTLANAQKWLQQRSRELTAHQKHRINVHDRWVQSALYAMHFVLKEIGAPTDWLSSVKDVEGWWNERMNDFILAHDARRGMVAKIIDCANDQLREIETLHNDKVELKKVIEKRGELMKKYVSLGAINVELEKLVESRGNLIERFKAILERK